MESTATWYWLRDLLVAQGVDVRLGHCKYIKAISYAKVMTDAQCPTVKDFVSYCRLVPAAKNSGGKQRQQRSKDGNRYLKLAFHHAAVRAIQYFPEITRFYQGLARRKPKGVARAIVAKELARTVYFALSRQEHFNGTFKGVPLSRRKTVQWPRLANPPV